MVAMIVILRKKSVESQEGRNNYMDAGLENLIENVLPPDL
jgi:hypothetical protein